VDAKDAIADWLNTIAKATLHSTYRPALEKDLALVASFAKQLLLIGAVDLMPPPQDFPATNMNRNRGRSDDSDSTLRNVANAARESAKALAQTCEQIKAEPPDSNRRQLIQGQFSVLSQRFLARWSQLFPALQSVAAASQIEDWRKKIEEVNLAAAEVNKILSAVQDASAKAGAAKHAGQFAELSGEYKIRARYAMILTILLALAFTGAAIASILVTVSVPEAEHAKLVQVIVGKILALLGIYYLVLFAARSYRANAHLSAINRHRATALQTFETFANSSSDEQTKNAVLLETTRSIYQHAPTGFLSDEESAGPTQIIEILKAIGPQK
jgi:hypothetical protein